MSQFIPRPEAQATTWAELMPPVQNAVHDLLVRIQGAHNSIPKANSGECSENSKKQAANCFLVYGLRGTGKTTVLLNTQRAVSRNSCEVFFEVPKKTGGKNETEDQRKAREDAREHSIKIRDGDLVWLEILNLEPLPSEANLLTVLLTQIRNALHSHYDKRRGERRSIFEEEADSARQQLNKLIENATLMWQNISEPDTRNLSLRQIKAADIYAEFQKSFKKAMDKLVKELSNTPDSEKKLSIVLPIDNIDRSTDHLQSIVKLAQLVSHPNLWLIMAGDRVEVETFLERAYWKELIKGSDGSDARGKIDSDDEDEALVMARRQANATAQKLWPANHRVEVNLVKPEQTLEFRYRHHSESESEKDIRALLKSIHIPTTKDQREKNDPPKDSQQQEEFQQNKSLVTLYDFFDVTDKVKDGDDKKTYLIHAAYHGMLLTERGALDLDLFDVTDKEGDDEKIHLTRAAYHGLLLSARSVLDLWQLLDWLVKDQSISSSNPNFKAEKVARTMLRIAIAGGDMPSGIAQDMQNYILSRGEKGGTILDFSNYSLRVMSMISANHSFEHALEPVFTPKNEQHAVRSQLMIHNIEDIAFLLKYNYSPMKQFDASGGHVKNSYPQPFVIETANEEQPVKLPSQVAAWLMVLHDILVLAEAEATSWVLGSANIKATYPNVRVHHTAVELQKYKKIEFISYWSPPDWRLFWGRNIFSLRWQNFRKNLAEKILESSQKELLVPIILATGWVFCVLKTSFELITYFDPEFFYNTAIPDEYNTNTTELINNINNLENALRVSPLNKGLEIDLIKLVNQFYILIQSVKNKPSIGSDEKLKPIIPAAYEVMIKTGKWLETEFIYFLSPDYVPIKPEVNLGERNKIIWDVLSNSALKIYWKNSLPFIKAELNEKFPSFEDDNNQIKTESKRPSEQGQSEKFGDTKNNISLANLLYADVYQRLESSDKKSNA